jgi:hypothetical protein
MYIYRCYYLSPRQPLSHHRPNQQATQPIDPAPSEQVFKLHSNYPKFASLCPLPEPSSPPPTPNPDAPLPRSSALVSIPSLCQHVRRRARALTWGGPAQGRASPCQHQVLPGLPLEVAGGGGGAELWRGRVR